MNGDQNAKPESIWQLLSGYITTNVTTITFSDL